MTDRGLLSLAMLLRAAGLQTEDLPADAAQAPVRGVTADSRAVKPGWLFVAVSGLRVDGHQFILKALAAGASALVGTVPALDLPGGPPPAEIPYIQVADGRAALARLSAAWYDFPSRALVTIGVTGTDGKTTTCTILESILSTAAEQTATEDAGPEGAGADARSRAGGVGVITTIGARIRGHEQETGFHVTTPDAPAVQGYLAQMRDEGCAFAIVESTSHGLHQQRVAAVEFDAAAVTNITHEHLDYHGTWEAYVDAKALLFRALFHSLPKPGVPRVAVLNWDDESYEPLRRALADEAHVCNGPSAAPDVRVISYSLRPHPSPQVDLWPEMLDFAPDATRFTLCWWGGSFPVESSLIGAFNVANILSAAGVALGLGLPPAAVQRGVARLPGVLGRMQRIEEGQNFLAVVDFAHSPVSLERALETLRPLVGPGGRLISIFGSAGLRDRAKRGLMGAVSGRLADYTIITAEDPRTEDLAEINRAIAAGVEQHADAESYRIVPDRTEAILQGVQMARRGDVVAAFGKGHERSMCFGETEYPWSDQDAMRSALRTLKTV